MTTANQAAGLRSGPGTEAAIEVSHLRKTYGPVVAVDDVSLSVAVAEGEISGILGPDGAGKATTVECVIGLRTPDAGLIRVMGLDPHRDREGLLAIVAAWAICFAEGDVF